MPEKIVLKRFYTWTEILIYLDYVAKEYYINNIRYKIEVWFSETFNDYKVYIIIRV